jgi:hypothetical protein
MPQLIRESPPRVTLTAGWYNLMTCSIENCGKPAIGKGLCRTHYMRARRTGDPQGRRKPGRPRDDERAKVLALFPEWSRSTQQRYWRAFRRLMALNHLQGFEAGDPNSPYAQAIEACTRPGGGLNVDKLSRIALARIGDHLASLPEEEAARYCLPD